METKTIEQALKEGYEKCGLDKSEWQCLVDISDLTEEDLSDGYYLAQKEANYYSFNKEQIADLLADVISDNYSDETGRDDNDVYDAIKKLDFSQTEKTIESALSEFPYWYLTKIKLIPKSSVIDAK